MTDARSMDVIALEVHLMNNRSFISVDVHRRLGVWPSKSSLRAVAAFSRVDPFKPRSMDFMDSERLSKARYWLVKAVSPPAWDVDCV